MLMRETFLAIDPPTVIYIHYVRLDGKHQAIDEVKCGTVEVRRSSAENGKLQAKYISDKLISQQHL
jgi:hypothetical protein